MATLSETVEAIVAEASALLEAGDVLSESLARFFNSPEAFAAIVRCDTEDCSAGGALKVRLLVNPSEAGLDLLAALRAGNVQLDVIQKALGHFQSPVGCDSATVEATGGDVNPPPSAPAGASPVNGGFRGH